MINCTICGSNNVKKIINWDSYSIFTCHNCRVLFADPLPEDKLLLAFYQGFMFNKPEDYQIKKEVESRKKELTRLYSLTATSRGKKFLDYGGGTGSAYKAATDLGMESYYHDLDEEAKLFAIEKFNLKKAFIIDTIKETNIKFDYILSDNVIEHLKDPIAYVREMREKLNEDGVIVIKTPHGGNTESFFVPLITIRAYFLKALRYNSISDAIKAYFKRFWHCDPPRHLFSFSKRNLEIIAHAAGFSEKEIEVSYYKLPFLEYSFTKFFFDIRRYSSFKSYILRIFIVPIIPIEFITRILQFMLLKIGVISPGGIVLKLTKSLHNKSID